MNYTSKLVDTNTELDYFVNPTLQELDSIESRYVRFVADNINEQVYCWDAYLATHSEGMRDLGLRYGDLWEPERHMYLAGWAAKKGYKYVTDCVDTIEILISDFIESQDVVSSEIIDKVLNVDWSWVDSFNIETDAYVRNLQGKWEKIKESKLKKDSKFYDMDKKTTYFVNPDTAELDSLNAGYIRLIIDFDDKKIYAWDGDAIIHEMAVRNILKLPGYPNRYRYHEGYAKSIGGRYVMQDYDYKERYLLEYLIQKKKDKEYTYEHYLKYIVEKDWSWVEYYFALSKGIKDILEKVPVRKYARILIVNKLISLAERLLHEAKFYDADKRTEYFVNPTLQELDSISSGIVRFIADNDTKQVYCWDGDLVLHNEAIPFIGVTIDAALRLMPQYLLGTAVKRSGKYVLIDVYLIESYINKITTRTIKKEELEILDISLRKDWSWINSYIKVNSYLGEYRDRFIEATSTQETLDNLLKARITSKLFNLAEKITN